MRLEIYTTLQNVSNKSYTNFIDVYILDHSPFFSDMMATLLKEEWSSILDSCEAAVFPGVKFQHLSVCAREHKV